ncbi:unnamed protein product [Brassica oleracea var. botrytis]
MAQNAVVGEYLVGRQIGSAHPKFNPFSLKISWEITYIWCWIIAKEVGDLSVFP